MDELRNTAVPRTRVTGLRPRSASNVSMVMALAAKRSASSARPRFQVVKQAYTTIATRIGNQPPCTNLMRLAMKYGMSIARKSRVTNIAFHSGQRHA